MAYITEIKREIIKDVDFYNCKKCGKDGIYNKNKTICEECKKKLLEKFEVEK